MNTPVNLRLYALAALLPVLSAGMLAAQTPAPTTQATTAATTGNSERPPRGDFEPAKGPTPRTAEGRPDLTGYWIPSRKDKPGGNIGKDYADYKLPFTPAGQEALKYNVEHTVDPEALCIVGGVPRHNASALPFEIVQGKDHSAFLYWYTTYRLIPFNGEKHSDDPDPSFFGEEIGSWDGDTFVIDSIGFKDKRTWADENANPHSDQLHLVERWTRPDLGHLHLEEVINDPKYYTEPVHYQRTWLLGKPEQEVKEYSCSEDNVDAPHLGPGPGVIGKDGERGFGGPLAPLPPPPDKDHPAVTSIPN